jgi:DNA-directed RNA polymerase specialized sigma24 family protein
VWEREQLKEAMEDVREHYDRLGSPKTFIAFQKMTILSESPADVAEELGMSVDSVHQAKTRVVKMLRDRMAEKE